MTEHIARINELINNDTNLRGTSSDNSLCIYDPQQHDACIVPNSAPTKYYASQDEIKDAILSTMQYGDYNPQDCSWACGNESALYLLAYLADLTAWTQEQEKRLNIVPPED